MNSFRGENTLAAFVESWQDFQLQIQIIFLLEQLGLRADAIVKFFVLNWIWTVRNSFPAISVWPDRNHKIFREGPDFADRFLDHHLKLLRCFLSLHDQPRSISAIMKNYAIRNGLNRLIIMQLHWSKVSSAGLLECGCMSLRWLRAAPVTIDWRPQFLKRAEAVFCLF